jgi:hypothetical protein
MPRLPLIALILGLALPVRAEPAELAVGDWSLPQAPGIAVTVEPFARWAPATRPPAKPAEQGTNNWVTPGGPGAVVVPPPSWTLPDMPPAQAVLDDPGNWLKPIADMLGICRGGSAMPVAYCMCLAKQIPNVVSWQDYEALRNSLADRPADFLGLPPDLKLAARNVHELSAFCAQKTGAPWPSSFGPD